jgi:hypothetical protein
MLYPVELLAQCFKQFLFSKICFEVDFGYNMDTTIIKLYYEVRVGIDFCYEKVTKI